MKRRGFTLAELSIVIALSSVVLLAVTTMVISIHSYSRARGADVAANDEIYAFESRTTDWFSGFDTSDCPAPTVSADGKTLFCGGDGGEIATFDTWEKKLVLGSASNSYSVISDVTFSQTADNPNLVKCTLTYSAGDNGERTYSFMLLKRSVNAA